MSIYDIYDVSGNLQYTGEVKDGCEALALIELGCLAPEDIAFVRDIKTQEGINIINNYSSTCLFKFIRKN